MAETSVSKTASRMAELMDDWTAEHSASRTVDLKVDHSACQMAETWGVLMAVTMAVLTDMSRAVQ
jgi:hypothetical protein